MQDFKTWIMGVNDFPARWSCGNWTPPHGWTHIISDLMVWGAYMMIPIILAYFLSKRKDIPFPRVMWLFVAFIASCGTVHLIEAAIYWVPVYRISAGVKVITAAVSWATVLVLIPTIPKALRFKSPAELQLEIYSRKETEKKLILQAQQLQETNEMLEQRQAELQNKSETLEKMNSSMVGRELRMRELKQQIHDLQNELKKLQGG